MMNRRRFAMLSTLAGLAACGEAATTAPTRLAAPDRASANAMVNATDIVITSGISTVRVTANGATRDAYPVDRNSAWGAPVNGGSYVASYVGATNNGPVEGEITKSVYTSTFTLPANAIGATVTVRAYADNWAAVSLNGAEFGRMEYFTNPFQWAWNFGGDGWASWAFPKSPTAEPYSFKTSKGLVTGTNTISFALENWGGPEGLSFSATVTYDAKYIKTCDYVRANVSHNGTANSLCAKLTAAANAELANDFTAKAGVVGAFMNEVKAQTGKFVPAGVATQLLLQAAAL